MAMEERDRIDIIATLHDRFNKPADDIISKMEEMERQADDTGDKIDDMSDSLNRETDHARDNTKEHEKNAHARQKAGDAADDQADAVRRSTRGLKDNNRALRDGLDPARRHTEATREGAAEASRTADILNRATRARKDDSDAVQGHSRSISDHTKKTRRARDEMGRLTKASDAANASHRESTKAVDKNTDAIRKSTVAKRKDRDEWTKLNNKIKKVTSGFGKHMRPITDFYKNYFKIIGVFRSLLFSDIGALIPQITTAIVALGSAAVATLGPLGRLGGALGQVVPMMLAIQQAKGVMMLAFKGVGDALKVLNKTNAKAEEIAAAMKKAGKNTWEMAKYIKKLQDRFDDMGKSVRETLLEGMIPSIDSLTKTYLPILERGLTKTAQIMNGELKKGFKEFQTLEKQETVTRVLDRGAVASGLLVETLFSLADVILEIADAAGPSFIGTLTTVNEKLDKFAGWIRDNKEKITDFFNRSSESAGKLVRGISYILYGLYGMSKAAKPLEDFLYGGNLEGLEGWANKMNDPKQQEIMSKNYENMIPNLEAIGNLIGAIVDGAKEIAGSEYFAPLVNDLAENGIPTIVNYLKALDEEVSPQLLRISQAFSELDPDVMTGILRPLGDALSLLADALEVIVPLFNAMPKPLQDIVTYGLGLVAMGLPGLFFLLLGPLGFVLTHFETLGKLFEKLKNSKLGKWLGGVITKLKGFFKPIIDFVGKYAGKFIRFLTPFAKFLGKKAFAVIPVVGTIIAILWTLWDVLKWLWDNVKPFRDFMTAVWEWIVNAWNASIDWIVNTAVPWIVGAFQSIWEGIKGVGRWIANFYNDWIKPVVDAIIWFAKLVFVVVGTVILTPFVILWNALKPIITAIVEWFKKTIPVAMDFLSSAWKATTKALGIAWEWVKMVFGIVVDAIVDSAKWLWEKITGFVKWIVDVWNAGWKLMSDVITAVWNWIKENVIEPVVAWFMMNVWPRIMQFINFVKNKFEELRTTLTNVWNWIKINVIEPVINWFMTWVWPTVQNVINWLGNKFTWLKDRISNVWNGIKNTISSVYNNKIKPIFDAFRNVLTALEDSFRTARDAIGNIWDGLKSRVAGPAQYVVDIVYNNGIRKVWNELAKAVDFETLPEVKFNSASDSKGGGGSGGRASSGTASKVKGFDTGGYTGPGSKYQPAGIVHADEYVIRKESQRSIRKVAPGLLDLLNKYGSKALSMVGVAGYEKGGKVKDDYPAITPTGVPGGGANFDGQSAVDGDANVSFTNPFGGMIEKYTQALRDKFPTAGKFVDLSIATVKKLISNAKNFVMDKITGAWNWGVQGLQGAGAAIGNFFGGGGKGGSLGAAEALAHSMGLTITSRRRPGARTAQSGMVSLHALGRAIDVASSPARMMAYFNAVDSRWSPTELLYSPAGGRNKHRSGRRGPNTGKTLANHYSHVHVGFHKGGLVPVDHMRFMGGPVETWGNTLVGEFGPELFMPSDGSGASLLGLHGPEVLSFDREGAIAPHKAVAALSEYNERVASDPSSVENHETNHYDVKVTVGGGSTEADIESAVYRAIAKAERKKRERR